MRPRCFRIDVIRRHRRHAAPIVNAGRNQLRQAVGPQVGRGLDVHAAAEQQARHRNGPHLLLERRLGCLRHARPGLGAEILDDDFLDVAVPLMHVADGKQRLDALAARFTDADQNAGGERHAGTPGRLQHAKAGGRILVGGTIVRPARCRQSRRGRLQHDALRHGHPAQAPQPSLVHEAGIEMGQQSRFPQHQLGRGFEIVEGGGGSQCVEGAARGAVAQLGLVAEREQGLLAAGRASRIGDRQHRIRRQVGRLTLARRPREGAVVTDVAAQVREGNEHLLRKRHPVRMAGEADLLRNRAQPRQVMTVRQGQGLLRRQPATGLGCRQRGVNCGSLHRPSASVRDRLPCCAFMTCRARNWKCASCGAGPMRRSRSPG